DRALDQAAGAIRVAGRTSTMSAGVRRASALGAIVIALAVFAVFPVLVTDPTATSIAVFTLIFMVATTAWNIFSGYTGYLALGHAVFFGVGGYTAALGARDWHFKGGWDVFALLPVAGLVAAAIAIPVGLIALRVRRHAFVISAFPVGMVGGLYFYFLGQIFPQFAFDPLFDISLALMAFFGGIGTLLGPLLGALVLESLQQYLTQSVSGTGTYLIAYGVLFLAVIMLLPRGVIPTIAQLLSNRRARAARGPDDTSAEVKVRGSMAGVAR